MTRGSHICVNCRSVCNQHTVCVAPDGLTRTQLEMADNTCNVTGIKMESSDRSF